MSTKQAWKSTTISGHWVISKAFRVYEDRRRNAINSIAEHPGSNTYTKRNLCFTHFMVIGNLQPNNFDLFGLAKKLTGLTARNFQFV